MKRVHPARLAAGLLAAFFTAVLAQAAQLTLSSGWSLQSSAKVSQSGATISTPGFSTSSWYPITMPASVIAGLLQNKVYADPYYGKNLSSINAADFTPTWWYRTEFTLPASESGKRVWLKLEGLNYRAAVWFNGNSISATTNTVGPFRAFEFDVTSMVNASGPNALAVQVTGPTDYNSDLTVYFVDWNPAPPDKNMGILNDVVVSTSGAAKIRHPLVSTKFDLPSLSVAHLTVVSEVTNGSGSAVSGTVDGSIGSITFSQPVSLAAHETKRITFTPTAFPQLNVSNPSIWWPWEYGSPNLNTLNLSVTLNGQVSDSLTTSFGIRQVTSALDSGGDRVFSVNGKPILIRGAAWAPDMFQRRDPARQEAEIRYARDLNLNAIRFEGKFEDDHMFDLADRYGLFVLIGWNCCDAWQNSSKWNSDQTAIALDSLRNQMYRLRPHPSMLVWMNGSDEAATSSVEQSYVSIESDLQWPAPTICSAAARSTSQEGSSGVKMNGPYDYEPPVYWETDTKAQGGGAWGFSTEISPGADVPPIESLQKFIPAADLWPIDSYWTFHCGKNEFANLDVMTNSLTKRYGAPTSAADYAAKAQVSTYESHRAMFEAYGRDKYTATGVIQWMMNNAWPGMFWHLYDYYLRPGGTYFGVKNALEPLHIQYSYVGQAITVLNSTLQSYSGLTATAQVYNLDGTSKYNHSAAIGSVGPDSSNDVFTLPSISGLSSTYFLRLTLTDASGGIVSLNTYWLSTKQDVVNWSTYGNPWQYTPESSYADFTALASMPAASVTYSQQIADAGTQREHTVTLTNTGATIAFFVRLKINRSTDGEEVLPVLWQDNYVTLLPGESRQIKASYAIVDLAGASPVLQIVPYLANVSVAPAGGGGGVAAPTFSPAPGTYSSAQTVTISSATAGASIRYTVDGSTPSATTGTLYSSPISISTNTTLQAIAFKSGSTDSAVTSGTYTFSTGGGGPISFEAESLARTTSGPTTTVQTDANTSGGKWISLDATATGAWIEFTLPNVPAGTYSVQLAYKTNGNRGQLTSTLDGTAIGTKLDQYGTPSTYPVATLGTATLAAGDHRLRLTVAGKNSASSSYVLSADKIVLTPQGSAPPPTVTLEAESMSPVGSGATVSTSSDTNASGGALEYLNASATGPTLTLTTTSLPAGTYQVQLRFKTNTSRGQHTVTIDGTAIGGTVDQYASSSAYKTVTLGTVTFGAAGTHTIKFTVTGKNSASSNYILSADDFVFTGQ